MTIFLRFPPALRPNYCQYYFKNVDSNAKVQHPKNTLPSIRISCYGYVARRLNETWRGWGYHNSTLLQLSPVTNGSVLPLDLGWLIGLIWRLEDGCGEVGPTVSCCHDSGDKGSLSYLMGGHSKGKQAISTLFTYPIKVQ